MNKDSTFRKVMQTRQDLKDSEGYDCLSNNPFPKTKLTFVCLTTPLTF